MLFQVSILVNNAGIVIGKKFMETPDHLLIRTMDVNVMAHFWVIIINNIYLLLSS